MGSISTLRLVVVIRHYWGWVSRLLILTHHLRGSSRLRHQGRSTRNIQSVTLPFSGRLLAFHSAATHEFPGTPIWSHPSASISTDHWPFFPNRVDDIWPHRPTSPDRNAFWHRGLWTFHLRVSSWLSLLF